MSTTNRRVIALAITVGVAAAHWTMAARFWRQSAATARAVKENQVSVRAKVVTAHLRLPGTAPEPQVASVGRATAVRASSEQLRVPRVPMLEEHEPVRATPSVRGAASSNRSAAITTAATLKTEVMPAVAPPLYAASAPEPVHLQFSVMRGEKALGEAEFDWQRTGDRYSLTMRVSDRMADDLPLITQTSIGRIDDHGLKPERFVDSRPRRGARAVNLHCDEGVVSYSTSTARHACVGGMQDNLSWWVQLAAVVSAMPEPPPTGTELEVAVARTHGSVDLWTFEVVGRPSVDDAMDPNVNKPVIRLVRRPGQMNRAYDTYAEVWLDADPPHWPLRVRLQEARGDALIWVRR